MQAKGDAARVHFGLIAQRVQAVFEAEGMDPFALGLLCYDEWEAEYADVLEEREVEVKTIGSETGEPIVETVKQMMPTGETTLVREAGNAYGLRYEECFALEAAYQRRRAARSEALLSSFEARLSVLEA